MMSLATIHQLSREIARRAALERRQPLLVEQEDLNYWREVLAAGKVPRVGIPNFGDYVPKGWRATERDPLFCDKFGDGDGGRSAGIPQILDWMVSGFGYAIVEEGEFQLYIGEFAPR